MAIQRAIINQERKTRRIWKDHGCAPSYSSIADFAILQLPWLCNIPHFFLMLKRHFVHQSKATFLWPCCMLPSKSGGQDEIWNKENVTAGNGGGKNLFALKWAEGQVLEWLFKGPHEMTACNGAAFQTLQENVPKLSEGKYCMGNYGTTLAEIPYFLIFFFFPDQLGWIIWRGRCIFGYLSALERLLMVLCSPDFFQRLAWKSYNRRQNFRSVNFCCSCEYITLCIL